MCATLNVIDKWLKLSEENYAVGSGMYNKTMKYMFKQIHPKMIKALISKKKVQTLMTEFGGGWYIEKL